MGAASKTGPRSDGNGNGANNWRPSANGGYEHAHSAPETSLSYGVSGRPLLTMFGPAATDIAGYDYRAARYTPDALVEEMIRIGELSPGARGMTVEEALDQHAAVNGFDREDEVSFDSDDHPKVLFNSDVTIEMAADLGREYWDFPDYDGEPRTAQDALDEWTNSQEIDFRDHAAKDPRLVGASADEIDAHAEELQEGLFQFTDRGATAEDNIEAIRAGAVYMGISLKHSPLPTRHNWYEVDGEQLNAAEAFDAWAESLELDEIVTDTLWEDTDYSKSVDHNFAVISANASRNSVDFDALGTPIPTRHN